MLNRDKLRGIEKWYPFAALSDPIANQYQLDRINNLRSQPELSEDQVRELNEVLQQVAIKETVIEIRFFLEGQINSITGVIKKLDVIKQYIVTEQNVKLKFEDIIHIEIVD